MKTDVSWLIGGPQGSGVESAANIFSRVCAKAGYGVFGKREFYSNIKGEHSYFVVRISDGIIRSNVNSVDLMVSYDAETIFRHADELASGGALVYDSDLEDTKASDVATLDGPFCERLALSAGKDATVRDILKEASKNGARLYPVSFDAILAELAEKTENPRLKNMKRMFNVIGVSLSMGVLGMPMAPLVESVESIFAKKPEVARLNRLASELAYARGSGFDPPKNGLGVAPESQRTILIQGYQGTALGKMACGCRFQPYYPITPASDESVYLESNEILQTDDGSGSTLIVQTEDEICAIGMAIGGALTGTRSATCTSGPGFSLMAEMLGWSGINEVPLVITLYQRSGPSTGLPTRHGQDDLLFAVNAGHGEFPKMVYASGDVEESFYDTARCFNYADIYQIPVIHMMDKFHASTILTCPRFDTARIEIERGKLLEKIDTDDYKRFEVTPDGISPRSRLGLEGGIFWNTGDESDEYGHISEDPIVRIQMMDKRHSKLQRALSQIPERDQAVLYHEGELIVVSWGSAKGPILDAVERLREEGNSVGFVQVKLLWPFPSELVSTLLSKAETIVDIESNQMGQLGILMRQHGCRSPDNMILKYTGRAMTSTEVYGALQKIITGTAQKREVLTHGA